METPRVSVVMPAYNAQDTIGASICSVLSQKHTNFEIIITNDGSTDGTENVVQSFSDKRIRYIKNHENCGVAKCRNQAVELATGEWVAFLDADDTWEPDKLSRQLAFAKDNNASITYTASAFMDFNEKRYDWVMPAVHELNYKELLKRNLMSCSSVMVRRDLIETFPFPSKRMIHEDYVVWLRILQEVGIAYGLDEPLLVYRLSSNSKSSSRIKSAMMTFNAYREVGYFMPVAFAFTFRYVGHSVSKRHKLKNGGK